MPRNNCRVVLIDHFDSFTFNLYQFLRELGAEVKVQRTDIGRGEFSGLVDAFSPTHFVLSPGPGHPKDVPLFADAIAGYGGAMPILGVCLGHQAIACAHGAAVRRNTRVMHGKASEVRHDGSVLFAGLTDPFSAMRYHSLAVSREECERAGLAVTAWTEEGEVMGIVSRRIPHLFGVQFHPESFFTEGGKQILQNFLA